jgi:hypothetical protein
VDVSDLVVRARAQRLDGFRRRREAAIEVPGAGGGGPRQPGRGPIRIPVPPYATIVLFKYGSTAKGLEHSSDLVWRCGRHRSSVDYLT